MKDKSFSVTVKPDMTSSDLASLTNRWDSTYDVRVIKPSQKTKGPITSIRPTIIPIKATRNIPRSR